MMFGTRFRQRDILIVPFPFTDLSSTKQRPVLVSTNDIYNKKSDDLVVCGITSNLNKKSYSIPIENKFLESVILPKKSLISVDKLFSIHKSLIRKKIGTVSKDIFSIVERKFADLI